MKPIKLIPAFLILLFHTLHAQQRMVLYESFTSETCPPSRPVDSMLWVLFHGGTNPEHAQFITYCAPYPSEGFLFKSNKVEYLARETYYSIDFVSSGRLDGALHDATTTSPGHTAHLTQAKIDTEAATPSPFNITAHFFYNTAGDSITIVAHVQCVATYIPFGANVKLRTAFVRTMDYVTPPGANGMTHFENIVRKMYPSPSGLPIANMWTVGDSATFTITGPVYSESGDSTLHPHTSSPGFVVVWIQNDNDKLVEQAANALLEVPSTAIANEMTLKQPSNLIIYPNPARDEASILFEVNQKTNASIIVADIFGRVVYNASEFYGAGLQRHVINTKTYPAGNYYVKVQVGTKAYENSFVVVK